jgi:hypothetical protein
MCDISKRLGEVTPKKKLHQVQPVVLITEQPIFLKGIRRQYLNNIRQMRLINRVIIKYVIQSFLMKKQKK